MKIHNYSTRFASEYNWVAVIRCSKSLFQRSIRIGGHRLWNNLLEIKNRYNLNSKVFFNKLKKVLIENNALEESLSTVFARDNFQQLMNSSEIQLFLRYVHFMIFKSIIMFMPYFCERRYDFFQFFLTMFCTSCYHTGRGCRFGDRSSSIGIGLEVFSQSLL